MLPHDELYLRHVGVKGMHWGIRKSREERIASAEKRAKKYDKKAKKFDAAAKNITKEQDATMQKFRAGYGAGVAVYQNFYNKNLTNNPFAVTGKQGLALDLAGIALNTGSMKKNFSFKAEEARRKADRIRAKSMRDVNAPKAKMTFDGAKSRAKAIISDKHNQEKAIRVTKATTTVALTVYKNRKALKAIGDVTANLAIGLILKDRSQREAARSSLKALSQVSSSTKFASQVMKPGVMYLINPDGTLIKSGKAAFS